MGIAQRDHAGTPLAEEVQGRFGVLPNFYRTSPGSETLLAGLWAFALGAYLDSPLPPLFKERLFVYLSRFCEVRYCVIRHACFLAGLGRPAGDPGAAPQAVEEIIELLRRPGPGPVTLEAALERLEASQAPAPMPAPGTQRESDLLAALTAVFLNTDQSARARAAVRAVAGMAVTERLMGLLAFIRAAHYWTEIHPDLPLEPDAEAFLRQYPELARLLADPADAVAASPRLAWQAAAADLAADRRAQQRAQRDFIADAVHELRTPLTAVIAAIETLDRGAIYDAAGRELFFSHIRREAARLSRLCDSLVLFAEPQSATRLLTSAVGLRVMLEDIAAGLRTAPGVETVVEAPAGLTVRTSPALLERIVANLAENSAKYTARGRITLRAAAADGGVTVQVADTGPGLGLSPAAAVERFSRGGAPAASGFGLGLSMAHQAALALNASLTLGDNPGGGTLATLVLPQAPPAAGHVLVIDDEDAIRDAISYSLQTAGYQVTAAASGHEGLASGRERRFGLIVVDLLLPDMSGIDVIRRLRAGPAAAGNGTRILAVSAHTEAAALALAAGADQFMAKPFVMDRLLSQAGALAGVPGRTGAS